MKTKSIIALIAVAVLAVVVSCVKDLEEMGVSEFTEYIGTVVEKSTMQPIEGVKVQVTDGTHVHASTETDKQGKFKLKDINFEEVSNDYYLWLDGSALDLPSVQEELQGLGREIYDYKTLILYDKTNVDLLPKVSTDEITDLTALSTKVKGTVTSDGDHEVTERGVCFATHQTPTLEDSVVTSGTGTGSYTCTLTELTKATVYYVRAYATNSIGTVYGAQKTFTTKDGKATITTTAATEVKHNSAIVGGSITDDGGDDITARGVCWGTSENPSLTNDHTTDGTGTGSFTHKLQNLETGTTYYYRAYATNSCGTTYGSQKSFTTANGLPVLTTTSATNVTATSAKCGGNITDNGGFTVTTRGICWNTVGHPDTNDNHTASGAGNGSFTVNMTNLNPGTTYHVRAYAVNQTGIVYGNEQTFTTLSGNISLTTTPVSNITANSATSGGNITDNGGFNVTARGVCWNTMGNPNVSDPHTTNGTGNGSFTSNMTGLTLGTTYHVRAYATNSQGTSYGEEKIFTTSNGSVTMTISAATNITASSASCSVTISNDGGASITERGICWSNSQYPTTSGSHVAIGSGTGTFTATMNSLSPSTTYYVRAYAVNAAGTSYSNQISFTTANGLPSITTGSVSNITATTATCSGNVTSDGGFTVTAKGLCWSTSQYPTVSDSHSNSGSGTGSFNSSLTNLQVGTTYYVRAYATNSVGTAYGTQVSFTTGNGLPTVTTTAPTLTNNSTVATGGNVTSDGGFAVTARGVCYGIYPNPDLTSAYTHTSNGTGTGYFTSTIDNVTGTIYVRAYATNANGTAYGNQIEINVDYLLLPTFTYNGHTYKVAPSPGNLMTHSNAESYCNGLELYGYSDWRLPTRVELYQMYIFRYTIGGFSTNQSDYSIYWSNTSSGNSYDGYWECYFYNGNEGYSASGRYNVRPIRVED